MASHSHDDGVEITYEYLQLVDLEEACVVVARAFCEKEPVTLGWDSYPGMVESLRNAIKYLLTECPNNGIVVVAKALNRGTGASEVAGVFTASDFTDTGYLEVERKVDNLPPQIDAYLDEIDRLFTVHLISQGMRILRFLVAPC